jgi:tRNA A-37 threonylcarbamoyl transferase component Bud32/tetratricopeptide (TPR) repeat protein
MKTCRVCQRTYSTHFANCPQDGAPLIHSEEWAEGTVVRGKYRIIQKIGEGAMGAVYKALHMHFDEIRAIKVIAAGLASDKTFVKRFEQEAILARKLQHPNAVRVDDIDTTEDGQPFIVMEYIEGKNLRKIISTEGPMPARRVSAIVRQVASALDAAQRLGIVHRDIKPENIVLIQSKKEDVAKVLDFGIAKLKEGLSGTTATSVTDTGMVVGTPPYMSPEQAMAAPGNELDGRSDIYSLGIVMYQMLTDELPIKGETALQIVLAHIQTPPIPIQAARQGVKIPETLAKLVMKCLEKNREDRPANGQALIEELEKWEAEAHEKEEGRTLMVAAGNVAPRVAAPARSTVQMASGSSAVAGRTEKIGAAPAVQPTAARSGRGWMAWVAVLAAVAVAAAGGWRYRGTLMQMVQRNGDAAGSASTPQQKAAETPNPPQTPGTLPGATEKPVEPTDSAEKVAAESAATPPATPAGKALPPPDASKTRYYTDATGKKVSYAVGTAVEHNGFKAVQAEKNEARQIQRLDEFVAKFPESEMLVDAYALYYRDYRELKNFPKVIEYADKLVALGNKADANARFQALYARAIAYDALRPDDVGQAKRAKDAAALGLSTLNEIKKPENVTEPAFAAERKPLMEYFDMTAGMASMTMKDYAGSIAAYKAALALDPEDGNATYQLGLAYWGVNPPRQLDAIWTLARAARLKSKGEPQSQEIKAYLRKLIATYEQTECLNLVETQLNELIQTAGTSLERPESFTLPSKADLVATRNAMSITTVVADLKAGGDRAKMTWLAACGMEFPNVPSKVISVGQGEPVGLKVALVTTEQEFRAVRRANMDFTVDGQPEAGSLAVGSLVRFTGTLASYERAPFTLHWQKAKINAQDIPGASK